MHGAARIQPSGPTEAGQPSAESEPGRGRRRFGSRPERRNSERPARAAGRAAGVSSSVR